MGPSTPLNIAPAHLLTNRQDLLPLVLNTLLITEMLLQDGLLQHFHLFLATFLTGFMVLRVLSFTEVFKELAATLGICPSPLCSYRVAV